MSEEKLNIETIRHSLSHVMAAAVLEMFPDAKIAIGPAIENGFYYDFDLPKNLTPADLEKIEKKMHEIIAKDFKFEKSQQSSNRAIEQFKDQPYKIELIKELESQGEKTVSIYTLKRSLDSARDDSKAVSFADLCKGPHVESTSELKSAGFKLDKIAGAYWRGDEKNKMLQRIYGLAFESQKELDEYLKVREEAEKRDHRRLGRELDLFVFSDLVGAGLPIYTQKGALVRKLIQNYSNELRQEIGYQEVHTPQITRSELFKVSGHYDKYKDSMFCVHSNYSEEEFFLKPMNCPQHVQVYASKGRSYKDLPIRIADFANLYRDEKPGELSGLTRLRAFSQDDGHCFCREDQIKEEFEAILGAIKKAMACYGMEYYIRLSLRDESKKEKYLGDDATWEKSQKILEDILKSDNIDYKKAEGEAAFYGPKMDLLAKDSLGREWQLSTIQLDFNMPKRFELEYIGEDGKKHTPIMIHSAIVGSPERFMGVLIEHYAGAFPTWLAPVQAIILPISDKHLDYAKKVAKELKEKNIRVEIDDRSESVGRKIRDAEMQKIPYMLIVGDKEVEAGKVAVRKYGEGDKGQMEIEEVIINVNRKQEEFL